MSSFYDILQVNKHASQEDIKRSYRNLARQHHPDKGGDTALFQKIQEAYETLGDEQKRAAYDAPPHQPFHPFGGGNSMFDMFMNFGFQHMNINFHKPMQQLPPVIHTLDVSLHEALHGISTMLQRTLRKRCDNCLTRCPECNGQGAVMKQFILNGHIRTASQMGCQTCGGNGLKFSKKQGCECQNGFCIMVVECKVDIQGHQLVPGQSTIRFAQLGEQSQSFLTVSSDFVVGFQYKLPANTSIEQRDIVYRPSVPFTDLLCGTQLVLGEEWKAVSQELSMSIPPMSMDPTYTYTAKGKGLYKNEVRERGDLFIRPQIDYTSCKKINFSEVQLRQLKEMMQVSS